MKSIKCFEYKDTYEFERFLSAYGYWVEDVKGFRLSSTTCYNGNIYKTYAIYAYDGKSVYFSVAFFKSFDEYRKAWLGFSGDKILDWYAKANIVKYKVKDDYGMKDWYVIAD